MRVLDAVDLLIGFPAETPEDTDQEWIRRIITELREELSSPGVAAARMAWWPYLDEVPLALPLLGLAPPPELPETSEEAAAWLASTRHSLDLPDVVGGVARFVAADTPMAARAVAEEVPAILDVQWKSVVEVLGGQLLELQETAEQRSVVEQRLSRLRQMATNRELAGVTTPKAPADAQDAVDFATQLRISDPRRLLAMRTAVEKLRPYGPAPLLAAALTSLVATELAEPSRSVQDSTALEQLALEAKELSSTVFGDAHEATLINTLNLLILRQDRPDLELAELVRICDVYEELLSSDPVRRSGHLVDVLNNLAAAFDSRSDLSRGERQEAVLEMFETVEHITRLSQPSDIRSIVLALVNQAAVHRQKVTGARGRNMERAWALLDQAETLEREHEVLHPAEKVQIATNQLNVAYGRYADPAQTLDETQLLSAVRHAVAQSAALHEDNETAIVTQVNTGAVLVDLYVATSQRADPLPDLLQEAMNVLEAAHDQANALFPAGHRTRLTAKLNLASACGVPAPSGGTHDAERCANLLQEVADEAAATSLDHQATALTNLGTLRVGQGRWAEAAQAYLRARDARAELVRRTSERGARLGEVVATGDLASRAALAQVHLNDASAAMATLESSRAALLRHRRLVKPSQQVPQQSGRAIVYLASCNLGTLGLVSADNGLRAVIGAMPSRDVSDALRALVTARTRVGRMIAFDAVSGLLGDLIDVISSMVPDDTSELCLICCGPLAGAPLHAIAGKGGSWNERWLIRYWPSAEIAAHIGEPSVSALTRAVAVLDPSGDLPLARAELESVGLLCGQVATPPEGWSKKPWLTTHLRTAGLAHFACHATTDLRDPSRSAFNLGDGEFLTVDELLEGPDVHDLELVVASACQSGVPAPEAPDELLGIAYGLVHVGAKAAITTLWEVNDTPAALCVARLYEGLAHGLAPAQALHEAQRWLARVTNDQLNRLCADRVAGNAGSSWLPYELAQSLHEVTGAADRDERPYSHPADWGAFTYLGA